LAGISHPGFHDLIILGQEKQGAGWIYVRRKQANDWTGYQLNDYDQVFKIIEGCEKRTPERRQDKMKM
jgi:hypothetical protein